MNKLSNLETDIAMRFQRLAKAFRWIIWACKYAVILGSFLIATATFALTPAGAWSTFNYVGVAGAIIVLFSAVMLLGLEVDSATALEKARAALGEARKALTATSARERSDVEEAYEAEIARLSNMQAGRDHIRAVLEGVAAGDKPQSEDVVIDRLLTQAQRWLLLAHGFELQDHYTICVYRAHEDATTRKVALRCISHIRSIMCDISLARPWAEGVGVAGTAFARKSEIVVPDLRARELGSLYNLPVKKEDDDSRYASIVAEPIVIDGGAPWGVITATSSIPEHFSLEDRRYVDVTQSLAGMIGLAIKVSRARATAGGPIAAPN